MEKLKRINTRLEKPNQEKYYGGGIFKAIAYRYDLERYNAQTEDDLAQTSATLGQERSSKKAWRLFSIFLIVVITILIYY